MLLASTTSNPRAATRCYFRYNIAILYIEKCILTEDSYQLKFAIELFCHVSLELYMTAQIRLLCYVIPRKSLVVCRLEHFRRQCYIIRLLRPISSYRFLWFWRPLLSIAVPHLGAWLEFDVHCKQGSSNSYNWYTIRELKKGPDASRHIRSC